MTAAEIKEREETSGPLEIGKLYHYRNCVCMIFDLNKKLELVSIVILFPDEESFDMIGSTRRLSFTHAKEFLKPFNKTLVLNP